MSGRPEPGTGEDAGRNATPPDAVYIAVCGAGDAKPEELRDAEEVGRLLAAEGAVVVTGGMSGVMHAAAHGATGAGGVAVGLLPGLTREGASPSLTAAIPTGLGEARNAFVVRACDAVIAISGEFGTLSEIALALKVGLPVVGLRTWELAKAGERVDAIEAADDPADAVRRALMRVAPGRTGA